MEILKAIQTDIESIIELNKQFAIPFAQHHLEMPFPKYYSKEWVSEEIENNHLYVLKDNPEVLGAMCLAMSGEELVEGEAYLESLAIAPNNHHKGYGRKLVEFAKQESKQNKKKFLTVESFWLYNAKDFYLKCGFELEQGMDDYFGHKYYRFFMDL